ncbi:MAG TPA: GspE/PulE family protein [bacterium]|nr:GspE/PulE family protein [bacterium]
MQITLSLDFVFDLLEEYGLLARDKRELFTNKRDYYETLYKNRFKKDPFVTDLVLSMFREEGLALDEEKMLKLIAGRAGCDYIVPDPLKIDSQLVITIISLPYGRKHLILPLYEENGSIVVAMADPFRMEIIDQLQATAGKPISPVVASPTNIDKILGDVFGFKKSMKAAAQDKVRDNYASIEQLTSISEGGQLDDKHIVNAVDYMLRYAVEQDASDIHIEPKRDETHIRFRLDGMMHTIYSFPIEAHTSFLSRLKMLARMDIAEKRRPQDGRIKLVLNETHEVELRASTIPVIYGEKMVLRILESGHFIRPLEEIGFDAPQLDAWRIAMKKGYGMLLVTGPTGSGKSTTLYSTLKELAQPDINIVAIEDPIEIVMSEINQMGVNTKAGITFSTALRHILRQDPDIIMVGEIRDKETADNAVQAALTGHLVFSTLHTNDTASTVERMIDLGIEPFLLASMLSGILAQRLVRKLCPYCSFERDMTDDEKVMLKLATDNRYRIKDSEGCVKCRFTGYKGRTAIIEYMPVAGKTSRLVATRASTDEIRQNAIMDGMITLRDSAIRKLAAGQTSFDEIVKALYFE